MDRRNAPLALLPDNGTSLLRRELEAAFAGAGWRVLRLSPEALAPEPLARALSLPPGRSVLPGMPELVFSVNFQGLDKRGENYALLKARGVPVAVWCVDNPWNLVSGLRTEFWKDLQLFVTDPGFIPDLEAHGARQVRFLPLATDPALFTPDPAAPDPASGDGARDKGPLVFVGRSAFPDKERFFLGQSVPEELLHEALTRLRDGQRSDFFWWLEKMHPENGDARLWPGSAARRASLGAEQCSQAWRAACLRAAAPLGLTVYGDAGWEKLLPPGPAGKKAPELRPPLDYYSGLARVYGAAPLSLNVTSLLLPQGLTQRHFDVWAAGGFLLSDATPGLALFPDELTAPMRFTAARDIPALATALLKDRPFRRDLSRRWREHILAEHSYARRIKTVLETVFG
jgi:hypothetical protein